MQTVRLATRVQSALAMAAVSNDSSTSDSSSCYLRGRRSSVASSFYARHYYSQDRVHLLRIAVVTIMGFLTLLVVSRNINFSPPILYIYAQTHARSWYPTGRDMFCSKGHSLFLRLSILY
jgi:hypothetical protein